jgi:hypothetical protein
LKKEVEASVLELIKERPEINYGNVLGKEEASPPKKDKGYVKRNQVL